MVHRKGLEPPTLGTGRRRKVAICNTFSHFDIKIGDVMMSKIFLIQVDIVHFFFGFLA